MFTSSPENSLFTTIKPHLGPLLTGFGSLCMAAVFAYGTFQHNSGVNDTQAKELERRVVILENSAATRHDVEMLSSNFSEFKADYKVQSQRMLELLMKDIRQNQQQPQPLR